MNYIINEYQTTDNNTAIVTPVVKSNPNDAENCYHTKLAAASISAVNVHTVTLETEDGTLLKRECYRH